MQKILCSNEVAGLAVRMSWLLCSLDIKSFRRETAYKPHVAIIIKL